MVWKYLLMIPEKREICSHMSASIYVSTWTADLKIYTARCLVKSQRQWNIVVKLVTVSVSSLAPCALLFCDFDYTLFFY